MNEKCNSLERILVSEKSGKKQLFLFLPRVYFWTPCVTHLFRTAAAAAICLILRRQLQAGKLSSQEKRQKIGPRRKENDA